MNQNQNFDQTTDAFALLQRVKPQTVRARLCNTGSYFGIKPKTLANGRLLWPSVQIEKGAI